MLRLPATCSALSGAGALQQAGAGHPLQLEEPSEGTQGGGESTYLTELAAHQEGLSYAGPTGKLMARQFVLVVHMGAEQLLLQPAGRRWSCLKGLGCYMAAHSSENCPAESTLSIVLRAGATPSNLSHQND